MSRRDLNWLATFGVRLTKWRDVPFRRRERSLGRFALVFSLSAAGFFPASAAPNYFTRTWQVEQGLPQNKVTAVEQARDGYL